VNLGVGSKYQLKDERNEQDIWQEVFLTPDEWLGVSWTHQIRMEQRYVGGVDGIIPRLRYPLHGSVPSRSNPERSYAFQNATRFNLSSNDTGPVDGFEQNRFYAGVGFKALPILRAELGYLWAISASASAITAMIMSCGCSFCLIPKGGIHLTAAAKRAAAEPQSDADEKQPGTLRQSGFLVFADNLLIRPASALRILQNHSAQRSAPAVGFDPQPPCGRPVRLIVPGRRVLPC
jgi:hypothetical protein